MGVGGFLRRVAEGRVVDVGDVALQLDAALRSRGLCLGRVLRLKGDDLVLLVGDLLEKAAVVGDLGDAQLDIIVGGASGVGRV